MTDDDAEQLAEQLRRTRQALDAALAAFTPMDEKLKVALTRLYTQREDELGALLSEVSQKAGILDSARMRAESYARHLAATASQDGALRLESNSAIQVVGAAHAGESVAAPFTDTPVGQGQLVERNGITIGVDSLSLSATHLRIGFHLSDSVPFNASAPTLQGVEALPLLTGLRVYDDGGGDAYTLELTDEVLTTGEPEQRLTSALTFTPAPAQTVQRIRLSIEAVVFAGRQAFLATPASARMVVGPWQFDLALAR